MTIPADVFAKLPCKAQAAITGGGPVGGGKDDAAAIKCAADKEPGQSETHKPIDKNPGDKEDEVVVKQP